MITFEPSKYGSVLEPLVLRADLPSLGSGVPSSMVIEALKGLTVDTAFQGFDLAETDMAACCMSGLWLLHDFLEESHNISQQINSRTGSFWHGIMHRRDGDFSNSHYWFRNTGDHPVYPELCEKAAQLAGKADSAGQSEFLRTQKAWNPFKFVDLCESVINSGSATETLCRNLQLCEWQLLFNYCFHQAIGFLKN